VVHVLVDGRPVLKDRRLLTLDAHEVAESARKHSARLIERVNG
jgi:hypothetical protein